MDDSYSDCDGCATEPDFHRTFRLSSKYDILRAVERTKLKRMRRDKLLEEQLVRLDVLYEYAKMHGEDNQAESIRRRMNKLTENV